MKQRLHLRICPAPGEGAGFCIPVLAILGYGVGGAGGKDPGRVLLAICTSKEGSSAQGQAWEGCRGTPLAAKHTGPGGGGLELVRGFSGGLGWACCAFLQPKVWVIDQCIYNGILLSHKKKRN